eukprot:Hpha_TRINITY_DN16346_c1_g2::TRINITY_DN16346_c1_g2_i2::g.61273::m.61273/K05601/hcp; hydroxylamine reductase
MMRGAVRGAFRATARQVALRRAVMAGSRRWLNLAEARESAPSMFCMQCEQTNHGGCDRIGMCGKRPRVSALQDATVHLVRGISQYAHLGRQLGGKKDNDVDRFVLESLFATMTNVNNDRWRFQEMLKEAETMMAKAKALYHAAGGEGELGGPAAWSLAGLDETDVLDKAEEVGLLARSEGVDEDVFSMVELIIYGVKGTAAYAWHAAVQGYEEEAIFAGIHETLAATCADDLTVGDLVPVAMRVGEVNLGVMALLEKAHIEKFGTPQPKSVSTTPTPGKCILVSGHDIQDTFEILKQTEGTGINVYTHGELLPAHSYPELAKFEHFKGHFGGAWQKQRVEFDKFPGPIVMSTNCLIEPKPSYMKRLFTRSVVGWPGVKHIDGLDFSEVVKLAKELPGFPTSVAEKTSEPMVTGFGADAILGVADKVVDAVKSGAIKHFYVIGGCDGREAGRSYFTDLAKATQPDSVILTLGCGKFRLNQLGLGDIGGIPRVLDVGQCNDAYGAVRVALALKDALGVGSVNDLPLSFGVSWFEQKAVAVLLTLLHLDIKNIHLGPKLPAFVTPNILNFLVENFGITPTGDAVEDAAKMSRCLDNNLPPKVAAA